MKRIILLLLCASMACAVNAQQATILTKNTPHKVYMFGFSASLIDSVAYMTDVILVDSAWLTPEGFLVDRTAYTQQMKTFLKEVYGRKDDVCVVFFDASRSRLEDDYITVRDKYEDDEKVQLNFLGNDIFQFHAEEYIPTQEYEVDASYLITPQEREMAEQGLPQPLMPQKTNKKSRKK